MSFVRVTGEAQSYENILKENKLSLLIIWFGDNNGATLTFKQTKEVLKIKLKSPEIAIK